MKKNTLDFMIIEGAKRNEMPKVSIVIPVYNPVEKFLLECMESVFQQTFSDYEVIVIDDGSENPVEPLLHNYSNRIQLFRNSVNSGSSETRNRGIYAAKGELIAFLDYDDVWDPKYLETQIQIFDLYPSLTMSFTSLNIINEEGRAIEPPFDQKERKEGFVTSEKIFDGCSGGTTSSVIKRDILNKIGGYDPTQGYFEDWDLWQRVVAVGPVYLSEKKLASYRLHSQNSSRFGPRQLEGTIRGLNKFLVSNYEIPKYKIRRKLARKHYVLGRLLHSWSHPQLMLRHVLQAIYYWPSIGTSFLEGHSSKPKQIFYFAKPYLVAAGLLIILIPSLLVGMTHEISDINKVV